MAGVLKLITADENAPKPLTGAEVMRDVAALIATHLPEVAVDDPYRHVLAGLVAVAPPPRAHPRGPR